MKIKRIIASLLLVILMLSCCSCTALDELREQHVRFSETSENILEYEGNLFYPIDLESEKFFGDQNETIYGVVTDYDVPLLLSQAGFNRSARSNVKINPKKTMIMLSDETNRCFLRKDVYDRFQSKPLDEFLNSYSFYYYNYFDLESNDFFLSKESVAAINEIVNGTPIKNGDMANNACIGTLNLCDEEQTVSFFGYSVFRTDDGGYFLESTDFLYEVPEKYRPIFDKFDYGEFAVPEKNRTAVDSME